MPGRHFPTGLPPVVWLLPALGLGLVTAGLVIEAWFRRRLGAAYEEFVRHRDIVSGMNTRKVSRVAYPVMALAATTGAFLMADDYACFSRTEIVINGFWSLHERRYGYSDVVWIGTAPEYMAPSGRIVRRREYVFRFDDGFSWSTLDDPSRSRISARKEIANFVASRSACPITEIPVLERKDM